MTTQTEIAPLVLIVSGPSGSGKSTLVQRILELPGTMPSISCTTRARRATEASGKCYDFVTEAEFDAMVARGEFLEYARVFGKHSYGTPLKWLEESRKKGLDLVLEIDVQGAAQVKEKLPESVAIFILPPSPQELERRLRDRGQDSDEEIARRLANARDEIAQFLDLRLDFERHPCNRQRFAFHAGRLGEHGVGLAMHLLQKKIQFLSQLAGSVQQLGELLQMTFQAV